MVSDAERAYLESARVGRLATADTEGRPHVVPICFAVVGDRIVSPLDEKPKDVAPSELRRVRNVRENPRVALVVDHYVEEWSDLGWVHVRGTASLEKPCDDAHEDSVAALEAKYDQYAHHDLAARPVIRIEPGSVHSWGRLERPERPFQ